MLCLQLSVLTDEELVIVNSLIFAQWGSNSPPPLVADGWLLRICRFGILGAKISFDLVSGGFGFVCKGPCTCPAVPGRVD